MKVHEFQAKKILAQQGVPVPKGEPAQSVDEVREITDRLGGRVVVKAQIHAGGRGKAGGVKLAGSADEAAAIAEGLLGSRLVTLQTGPQGSEVRRLLVEEQLDIAREFYCGIVLDRALSRPVMMASSEGGVEIEEVAARSPEKILRAAIDPALGLSAFQARELAFGLGLPKAAIKGAVRMMMALYRAYEQSDASLVEINPLVLTGDDRLIALDAKMSFDSNALYRHPEIVELRDVGEEEPLEVEASKHDLNYIKLDGNVGCMVNGAGLAMATMDIIKLHGGEPANFLDVGGGASAEQVTQAFRILLADPSVKAVLINIFGGILRCDVLAQGVVEAARQIDIQLPLVVRLNGTNVDEGRRILQESGIEMVVADRLSEAASKVCELAGAAKG